MRKFILAACLGALLALSDVTAQKLPTCNLVLFQTSPTQDGLLDFTNPQFLSTFNLSGYNNQPKFFASDQLYFTMQSSNDTSQSDLVLLDLKKNIKIPITETHQPEYSPTPMLDGLHFSCVKVQESGEQQLWAYPLDRNHGGFQLFEWLDNVGYHCWLKEDDAVLFLVGEGDKGHQLVRVNQRTRKMEYIASHPGRSMQLMANKRLAYVAKTTESSWFLKIYDTVAKTSKILIQTRPNSEDFCILKDGTFLMGEGTKLYQFKPNQDTSWRLSADLSVFGIQKISRLAANDKGQVVMVVE